MVGALGQPAPRAPRAARPGDRREGRTQPLVAAFNTKGYFFDAVVRHPVQVV